MPYSSEKLIDVQRAGRTESVHRGHIAVVTDTGTCIHALGNPQQPIYARSAAKPLQALAVLDSDAKAAYNLSLAEIALFCASHNEESMHTDAVATLLARIHESEQSLTCGAHYPFHKETMQSMLASNTSATTIHNNCSGKHAGMLVLAKRLQVSTQGYAELEHPVQQAMLGAVADMAGLEPTAIPTGTDGCGVPVFQLPLDRLAFAYAKLGSGAGCTDVRESSAALIREALASYPDYLAGEDRYDSQLIRITQGRVLGKMGAEGVFALCVPAKKIGVAVKVEDGNFRALYPAVTETLMQLNMISQLEYDALNAWHNPILYNHAGTEVGRIRPRFRLR